LKLNRKTRHTGEEGFVLLSVLILIAVISILLGVAATKIARDIQRDRELECMHRGQQYARAIRLFYRQTGDYPTNLDQLDNTNGIRYLRKRYLDPITRSGWKMVYQGEARSYLREQLWWMNPAAGAPSAALPPGVVQGIAAGGSVTATGFGSNGGVTQMLNPFNGQPDSSSSTPAAAGPPPASQSDPTATAQPQPAQGAQDTLFSNRRIVGVSSYSERESIRIFHKQTHYKDWQFIYDPAADGIAGGGQQGLTGASFSPAPTPTPAPLPQTP
jgi:type II secretory pathway pseudopilin PulG